MDKDASSEFKDIGASSGGGEGGGVGLGGLPAFIVFSDIVKLLEGVLGVEVSMFGSTGFTTK